MIEKVQKVSAPTGDAAASKAHTFAKLLTRRQVAERLGVCTHTVQRLTRRGALPALVFNRRLIRYTQDTVDAFIAQANLQ